MRPLDPLFTSEFDCIDKEGWYHSVKKFDDYNIYQTWHYDSIHYGERNISHFILRKEQRIVAAAQARILKIPLLHFGIAYIRWGPLWHKIESKEQVEIFRQTIRALRNEYVYRRKLLLRIYPRLFEDNSKLKSILKEEGYCEVAGGKHDKTLLVDITNSLPELRKNFKQKWRNCLNRAEKNRLTIIEGKGDDLFKEFIKIYREMIERKKFKEPNDINKFRLIQQGLPDQYKMNIMLCLSDDKLCAGSISSAIGKTGIYLFGATNQLGMKTQGAYLLQWRIIEWLKKSGCCFYDLNGINPNSNPGTYKFKAGVGGKNGKEVFFLGQFDTHCNILFYRVFTFLEYMRNLRRKFF